MGAVVRGGRLRPGTARWYDRASRYLALIALVITLVTTMMVFFVAKDELGAIRDLVAACIGLVGVTIALQLELLFRMAERRRAADTFGRLLGELEQFPDLLRVVAPVIDASVSTLRSTRIDQFKREVFHLLEHASAHLHELAQGRLHSGGLDNSLVLEVAAKARTSVHGTTDAIDTDWWRSDDGQRFLESNRELVQRGVRVERVWFVRAPLSAETAELLDRHSDVGVGVLVIRTDHTPLDRRLLVNMTIVDERFLQENVNNRDGRAVEYLYSEAPADLERARRTFAQLRSQATVYDRPESLRSLFPPDPPSSTARNR